MHPGTKEYCCAMTRTIADPSGCICVPRLASMNSPARCRRLASIVSTFEEVVRPNAAAEMITANTKPDDGGDDIGPPPFGLVDDIRMAFGAQPTAPRGRKTKKKKASQIASSTATDSPATASAPRGPAWLRSLYLVVAAVDGDVLATKGGRDVVFTPSSDVGMDSSGYPGFARLNAARTWAV